MQERSANEMFRNEQASSSYSTLSSGNNITVLV